MITRVRLEASAKARDEVQDDLLGGLALVQETYGGEWKAEEDINDTLQTTIDGWWGRLMLKRVAGT